jgi:uncharacterized membrane protein
MNSMTGMVVSVLVAVKPVMNSIHGRVAILKKTAFAVYVMQENLILGNLYAQELDNVQGAEKKKNAAVLLGILLTVIISGIVKQNANCVMQS